MANTTEKKKRISGMVRVRGGFSDSNEIAPCNKMIQTVEFDDASRMQLNNKLYDVIETFERRADSMTGSPLDGKHFVFILFKSILNDVLCTSSSIGEWNFVWRNRYRDSLKEIILNATYNEVLDTIEYICRWIEERLQRGYQGYFYKEFNATFEQEYIGYRFVNGRIVAITDECETEAISRACQVPFDGCKKHFQKAVGFLADRKTKDYKNCIKESISAVEAVCQIITGNTKAVLSDSLKHLEKQGTTIHPALSQAFIKLFAYTSDQGGIRHAEGLTESNVSFEEAKFILVSCSAFVNYLIAEYGKNTK